MIKIAESIDREIVNAVQSCFNDGQWIDFPDVEDYKATDSVGEVIEKLTILHIRTWMLEDAISDAFAKNDDALVANLKRKIDICFKVKRPKYVEALNRMFEDAIRKNKSLVEDSVKHYKGFVE